MPQIDKTWFAVVNPLAGSGKSIGGWKKAEKLLNEIDVDYVCAFTQHAGHAETLAMQAAASGYRRFAAVGGDGTAHEVFVGLLRWYDSQPAGSVCLSDFVIGVIPIGSGNDWIRSHEIPNNIETVIRLMKDESFGLQDVVRVCYLDEKNPQVARTAAPKEVNYVLNVAGIGFDSRICAMVNGWKKEGKTGSTLYFQALLKVVQDFYSFPVDIWADGEDVYSGECYSIAFGTGKYSGGGMRQVPDAVLDDCLLDMMVVPKMPIKTVLPKLRHLFTGNLSKVSQLIFRKARTIVVVPKDDRSEVLELDGETVGSVPVRFEVLPGQISVLSRLGK